MKLLTLIFLFLAPLAAFSQDTDTIIKSAAPSYSYLLRMEGYRLSPYIDGNCWTVGIGHKLGPLNRMYPRRYYTSEEIDAFFDADLIIAEKIARKGIKNFDDLPLDARLVTIGLIWTVGPTGFMDFKDYRKCLSKRDYRHAAKALFYSRRWGQIGHERANLEWDMMMELDRRQRD